MKKPFKRVSRHPSEVTKTRISQSLSGRSKSMEQRSRTSASMKKYWSDDSNFPADADEHANKI